MLKLWFELLFLYIIITVGAQCGFNIHKMAAKMRQMALVKVSEPWPDLWVVPAVDHTHNPFKHKYSSSEKIDKALDLYEEIYNHIKH